MNIPEIVEKVLPYGTGHINYYSENQNKIDRWNLAQAITEKKLVVPMSEEAILDILTRRKEIHRTMISVRYKGTTTEQMEEIVRKELAKSIYERQFKGDE